MQVYLGYDIELDIEFHNPGGLDKMVEALLSGSVVYYTGVMSSDLKKIQFTATIPGNSSEQRARSHARTHAGRQACTCAHVSERMCV